MDSPTLTFIVSLAGVLILLLLGIIGWFISFIVRNQTARNEEFAEVMKDLSGSILELKKVVSEISIGCRFKHERIDKFMDDFDK